MRFPLSQTLAVAKYIGRNKKAKVAHFPLVLMLEPLHACNLDCAGCGRLREYADTASKQVPLEDCLKAIDSCNAPVVSICGGEPMLYKDIKRLVEECLARGKVTYLCTNGTILDTKLGLFKPHKLFNFNIHLDGMEKTHDAIVGKPGTFKRVVENIRLAKSMGFTVCTNTTVYRETDVAEIEDLFEELTMLKVDGMLISPGFDYVDVAQKEHFLAKDETAKKFKEIRKFSKHYKVWSTPLFLDFLAGLREFKCTPWGNVTYNIAGWKAPCYLITDAHYKTYDEMIRSVDWKRYQSGSDLRCKNCQVHSGFEATVALETGNSIKDVARMAWWTIF